MSRAQGINTDTTKVLGLMLSNGLVALSGALLAQYQGSATIDMGRRGAIVIGLAAVIIGQVLLSRIFHNFSLKLRPPSSRPSSTTWSSRSFCGWAWTPTT